MTPAYGKPGPGGTAGHASGPRLPDWPYSDYMGINKANVAYEVQGYRVFLASLFLLGTLFHNAASEHPSLPRGGPRTYPGTTPFSE